MSSPIARSSRLPTAVLLVALSIWGAAAASGSGSGDPAGLESDPTAAWLVVRTGIRDGFAFRLVETVIKRDRWIQLDLGYFDVGNASEYRRMWVGGGGAVLARPAVRLELKSAFSLSEGAATVGERYLLSNAYLVARPGPRWLVEISHTESFPLDGRAQRQHALDRARLEYELGRQQLGVGYAGYRAGASGWEHRPFVSVSRSIPRLGEIELWVQRIERPDGPTARLQLRFARRLSG